MVIMAKKMFSLEIFLQQVQKLDALFVVDIVDVFHRYLF